MTIQNFTVEYSTNGTSWTALTNVQEINGFCGRRSLQDTFTPSSMGISLRYPTGFASPIAALVPGTWIRVNRVGATYEIWRGKIRDVSVEYGILYSGGVGATDYLQLDCEGVFAEFGRLQGNGQLVTADLVTYLLGDITFYTGLTMGTTFGVDNSPTLSDYTVNGTWAEYLNLIAISVGATIKDGDSQIKVATKDFVGTLPVAFSDTTNNATNQVYDLIRFDSLAENYYTQVQVDTEFYGSVVASSGAGPYRTLKISTINSSVAQAQDLANYYLGVYSVPRLGITEVSCSIDAQKSMNLELGYGWWDLPGYRTNVVFRGTNNYMTILGTSLNADARSGTGRYTYYLADADLTPYLILDSTEYGLLDQNKLSW